MRKTLENSQVILKTDNREPLRNSHVSQRKTLNFSTSRGKNGFYRNSSSTLQCTKVEKKGNFIQSTEKLSSYYSSNV